jgi:hypothetical protein
MAFQYFSLSLARRPEWANLPTLDTRLKR